MKKLIISVTLAASFTLAVAGPFGIDMGMTTEQIKSAGVNLKPIKAGMFEAKRLPKSLDNFELFELRIESGIGLCGIHAVGKTIQSNSFGEQLQDQFESTEQLLIQAYGKNKKSDYLKKGSVWSNSNEWIISLLKQERILNAYWNKSQGSTMKDNVSSILLEANGLNATGGYVDIIYEFENIGLCTAKSKLRESDTL